MPKLFVPVSYVDEQVALLKEEIAGLKKEVEDLRTGKVLTAVTVVKEPDPNPNQKEVEGEIDPTGSQSAGFAGYASPEQPSSPPSPTTSENGKKRGTLRGSSTQSISALGGTQTFAMVCFDRKSAWSIPLVTTIDEFSDWFDATLAMILLLANVLMQGLFIGIIQDGAFLGEDYSNQVDVAKQWRRSFAHDSKYLDLTDRSLASRVCNEDGSLIFANGQVEVLAQINAFLGMGKDDFEAPWLQPGVMLSVLCILLWCLCIFKEYRSIWHAMQGLYHVPKADRTTFGEGALQSMSRGRVAVLCAVCVVRIGVATMLMINGSIWLSRTTSISELMLNAVALEAVLHVDEFLFSGCTPTKIQYRIQNLPPVRVNQHQTRNSIENFIIVVLITCALVIPFTTLLQPLTSTMLSVKHQMCGGNRTFIVTFNSDTQQTIGKTTRPIGSEYDRAAPMIEIAVMEHIFADPKVLFSEGSNETEKYIDFTSSDSGFKKWATQSMDDYGTYFPICLEEFLGEETPEWIIQRQEGGGTLARKWEMHFRSAAAYLGRPNATYCSDLADFCDRPDARLLRFACGMTCGCDKLFVNPLYRVRPQGCNQGCLQKMWGMSPINHQRDREISFGSDCTDVPKEHPAFVQFFDNYIDALSHFTETNFDGMKVVDVDTYKNLYIGYVIKQRGCPELRTYDDVSNTAWCRGYPGLYRPLAWICPETCGCKSSGDADRDKFCFGHDYCPFTVPENVTHSDAQAYLRRIDRFRIFLHTPMIQFGGHKLP